MAEKHKSKYKAPKDLEKSQKPKARKDLKDYTTDDKKGKLNPKSNGDTIPNLLRKTDKPFVDDGTYDVKWNADDRLYADLENGDYDPKKALKKLKKREDSEEKEVTKDKKGNLTKESLRDRIKKLTVEQKEALIKEYIRKKVRAAFLNEQGEKPAVEEPATEEPAVEEPVTTEPTAQKTPAAPAPEVSTAAAAMPTMPEEPAAEEPVEPESEETPEAPEAEETPEDAETENRTKEAAATERYISSLKDEQNDLYRLKSISNVINLSMPEEKQADFYRLLRSLAIKKIAMLSAKSNKTK